MLTQQGVKEAIRENSFVPIHFKIYEKDAQLPSQNGLSSHKTFKRKDCNECSGSLEGSLKLCKLTRLTKESSVIQPTLLIYHQNLSF